VVVAAPADRHPIAHEPLFGTPAVSGQVPERELEGAILRGLDLRFRYRHG
jgi:hypothetical protein